jgi:hypothetical protein
MQNTVKLSKIVKPQSLSTVVLKACKYARPQLSTNLGRLLASGRAGHDSVPRYDRPRGRKSCKTARQPACEQNDFVGGRRYFAFCHTRTSFVKRTVVQCQVRRKLSYEQNHFVWYELACGVCRVVSKVALLSNCAANVLPHVTKNFLFIICSSFFPLLIFTCSNNTAVLY